MSTEPHTRPRPAGLAPVIYIDPSCEMFSKTDQYEAWVREDLIAEHTPKPLIPDEPEPGVYQLGESVVRRIEGNSWWQAAGMDDAGEWEDMCEFARCAGAPLTITRLIPAEPVVEVELPWTWRDGRNGDRLTVDRIDGGVLLTVQDALGSNVVVVEPPHYLADALRAARTGEASDRG